MEFAAGLSLKCADALDDQVDAAFIHGSLALGDFVPGRSDLDMLIVVQAPLTDAQLPAVLNEIDRLSGDAQYRVDLRIVTRDVAAKSTRAPAMELGVALTPRHPANSETRVAAEPRTSLSNSRWFARTSEA
jgi:predicted nucleotidyltransferase